jgi:DNA-3-methyladenine glycosylase
VGVAAAADLPWRFWIDGSPAVSQYRPGKIRTPIVDPADRAS